MEHVYPFSAVVGQEKMKLALILNLINPALGGVLIRGEKGTAKSTAVRGLTDLMELVKVVENCLFIADLTVETFVRHAVKRECHYNCDL